MRNGGNTQLLQGYAYDATGNRQSRTDGSATTAYTYTGNSHRLSAVGAQSRGYDAVGNTLSIGGSASGGPGGGSCGGVGDHCDYVPPPPDPGHDPPPGDPSYTSQSQAGTASSTGTGAAAPALREFVYNAANRMSEVRHDGAVAMQYRYNGLGEQVLKFNAGRRTVTVYDESGRWIGDYDSTTGNPIQQVIWLHDLPVGVLVGSGASQTLYYIEPDMLSTPRVVLNPTTSQAVWRWDLTGEAFGDTAPNQDPDGDGQAFVFDMRFPGQRFDAATGMSYNYFRDYEAGTGRYSQSDPIGLMAGVSTYAYVSGSPLTWADMYGLLQWTLLPVEWNAGATTGTLTRTYPGARQSEFRENTLARTTMDWNISARCTCGEGGYSLDEFEVSLTPIVLMRQRYDSPDIRRSTRRDELDHVRDLNAWANGARAGAEQFENEFKKEIFLSEQACIEAARAAMQRHLSSGIRPAVTDSYNRWDASGRHRLIVPGS